MINGKGPVKTSSEVAPPDPVDEYFPWQGLDGGDASPVSSRYSSCGESEFDRYCSATSVMGTPSLCGSVGTFQDTLDSDFGSLKSFKLGDESALENLGWKSRYDKKVDDSKVSSLGGSGRVQRFESRETKSELEQRNDVVGEGSAGTENELNLFDEFTEQKANAEATEEDMFNSPSGVEFDGREGGRCSDEGETSSRYEHSEGEDSMFGCGTDDENQNDYYQKRNLQYTGEANNKNGTSLGMNSSIAFGSDDWDDFMQEHQENSLVSMAIDELQVQKQKSVECEDHLCSPFSTTSVVAIEEIKGNSLANKQVQDADEVAKYESSTNRKNLNHFAEPEPFETLKNMLMTPNRVESSSGINTFETGKNSGPEISPSKEKFNIRDGGMRKEEHGYTSNGEARRIDDSRVSKSIELEKTKLQLDLCSAEAEVIEDEKVEFHKDSKSYTLKSLAENGITRKLDSLSSSNLFEEKLTPVKTEMELNGFYEEIVNDMEEILLDSGESPGSRFSSGSRTFQYQISPPLRDGGSTASTSSTSGTDDTYQQIQRPMKIDRVEVVGARQKKGDVSFSERLVGVKEYTVYQIRVWSGTDNWVVERRYRDFSTLYRRLKTLFTNHGWLLPSHWSYVERESRKYFGNSSPDVVAERSVLIQECLRSILDFGYSSNSPGPLIWFLSPSKGESSDINPPQSPFSARRTDTENFSTLGKTISLIVEIQPYKSTKQILESQHYTCAGCHKHFDDGKTRMLELVQTLGWGKPRLCAYSGQLFCSSCHTNDTAVLPARVLHLWDFTQYPISQMAKSYLDSIHDQPMLCVSAVNPFLLSKVPALQHVTNVRKRIEAMLPYVRCPFRRNIHKGLGSRRYLLESTDFFALRDLIDLSKGIFAALPVMVETVSRKILEHITEQCLICYDTGVPCNARLACEDPSALIFPFQEGEVERCSACESVFHKPCLKKMASCPCGKRLNGGLVVDDEGNGTLDLLKRKENSSSNLGLGLLSGLFSRGRSGNSSEGKDGDTVILMGSLPSTSL